MTPVRNGWNAALEWAAAMIEGGYPEGTPAPSPSALAVTLRAKKNDVDLHHLGMAAAMAVYESKRPALAPLEAVSVKEGEG